MIFNSLLYIVWDPSIVAFKLGPLSVRWYALCWMAGLIAAYFIVKRLYKQQRIKDELLLRRHSCRCALGALSLL